MKTQFTKLLAAAMLLTAPLAASATTTERSVKISKENKKTVVLHLGNPDENTGITLRDQNGKLLFEENTSGDQYTRTFDLKAVEEGEIYLEIESEGTLEILPIEVTNSSAYIKRSEETVIEKPIVKMNGEQAKVFFGDNGSDMKVTLFDSSADIAFRETVANGTGSKTYDMSKLAEGSYKLQFSANGRTFYHTIILN